MASKPRDNMQLTLADGQVFGAKTIFNKQKIPILPGLNKQGFRR